MTVLNDFDESVAAAAATEKKRLTEGILKKGEEKIMKIQDGQIVSFGKDKACDIYIPLKDLDLEQFAIFNRDGALYIVDKSNEYPTRIKVGKG